MQIERRHDPYPWTWEPAAAITIAVVLALALALGLQLGRALANLAVGAGWTWPMVPSASADDSGPGVANPIGAAFSQSIPGVLSGDAAAGLTGAPGKSPVAGSHLLWTSVAVTETLIAVGMVWAGVWVYVRYGPGRLLGMAPRREAERLLGLARVRRDAKVVRPDLTRRGVSTSDSGLPTPITARREAARRSPEQVGWRIGQAHHPRGGDLWVPYDRTSGVIGPQGSGKTLDLLTPALLGAPGAALVTLTKVEDMLLSLTERSRSDRPCVVLDPFGLAQGITGHGIEELVWDPIVGCVDAKIAERRAKAFTAGTVRGAISGGTGDEAARFYAAESAKVLQSYFHAAALAGKNLDVVLRWIANPAAATQPVEILRRHPHAEPFWHGLLNGALRGDDRTASNTITTVQQAVALFFQGDIRRRCVPGAGRAATDLADVIRRRGTIYLLGRDDPYASASPLLTAVAEHVLDTGLLLASRSAWGGRLCPPLLSVLDELPSTAPLPTLRTRMANERALGLSFIWAAQTRAQLTSVFGDHEARALLGLTNVLIVFGGSKEVAFNQEISDLLGTVRVRRVTHSTGGFNGGGRTYAGDDIPVLRPEEVRQLSERQALVIAENGKPIIAKLSRCIEGKAGRTLLATLDLQRKRLTASGAIAQGAQADFAANEGVALHVGDGARQAADL